MDGTNERLAKLEALNDDHGRRIARNEALTEQIHRLAASMDSMSVEVRGIAERMDKLITGIDTRLKEQGLRIGDIEKKGSRKLEEIAKSVLTALVVAAAMYFLMGQAL